MTTTEQQSPTELFIHRLYEEERPAREYLGQPENIEYRHHLALALIDLATELYGRRIHWRSPLWQFVARGWWRDYMALPTTEAISLNEALTLNKITPPGLFWE